MRASSVVITAGACLLFPVLIPMALGLVLYVSVAKALSGKHIPKDYEA